MSQASFDASIPVLTEVLKAEPLSDDSAAPAAPQPPSAAAQLEAAAIDGWTEAEWAMMEHRLSVRIMHQLQSRVDFVLEQRIKDSMAEVLSHALHDLTNEIRIGLHDTIEKIVSRAVAQELTHLQAQKK
ncbi:hypothetical protein FHW83_001075 [Duganella sp. SG902]|uniref:hypothetical protein n=1 Tax=Duganella sp. SG902 TaxID=2587016 RepID=UPI00159E6D19|nr:hypothetical protein [Duganella sp. SG902]NVM75295.1 hypothetical protein [Duganella sp. SG902]